MGNDRELADLILSARAYSRLRRGVRGRFGEVTAVGPAGYCSIRPLSQETGEFTNVYVVGTTVKVTDKRLMMYLPDDKVWVVFGDPKAGFSCPDIPAALNPVDKSYSETFVYNDGGTGGLVRLYGAGTYTAPTSPVGSSDSGWSTAYDIPEDRMWCVSDVKWKLELLTAPDGQWIPEAHLRIGGGNYHSLFMTSPASVFTGPFVPGDVIEADFPAAALGFEHFDVEVIMDAAGGSPGSARLTYSWTAVEFDEVTQNQ